MSGQTTQTPVKIGMSVRVQVEKGVPLCPWHGDPMVRVEAEEGWRCADGVALDQWLRKRLRTVFA